MALIETHLNRSNDFLSTFDMEINAAAANKSVDIEVPVSESADIIMEYAAMNGSISVKQADIVLVDDFLSYPNAYSLTDLDYYADKQSTNGPGMTYGVFSINANAYSPSGCSSYTYGVYASHPYVRAPWFQYSEQLVDDYTTNGGTHPAYPFLTGMGGANRVGIFGYLGLRLRLDSLNVDPSLPPQIPNLDFRTFYWQGHAINATSNATHTTISRIPSKTLPNANQSYLNSSIPVTIGSNHTAVAYELPPSGDAVVLPNRQIGSINTWPGNTAQCLPTSSPQDFEPGQFPFAINDGAVSTKWQPVVANVSSSVTIDLGEEAAGRAVDGFRFDWAQAPPRGFYVTFSNASGTGSAADEGAVNVTSSEGVEVSTPYDAASVDLIASYASNTTNLTLNGPVYGGRYVTLTIWGNQATGDDGVGATVAEFAVITGQGNTGNGTESGTGTGTGTGGGNGSGSTSEGGSPSGSGSGRGNGSGGAGASSASSFVVSHNCLVPLLVLIISGFLFS